MRFHQPLQCDWLEITTAHNHSSARKLTEDGKSDTKIPKNWDQKYKIWIVGTGELYQINMGSNHCIVVFVMTFLLIESMIPTNTSLVKQDRSSKLSWKRFNLTNDKLQDGKSYLKSLNSSLCLCCLYSLFSLMLSLSLFLSSLLPSLLVGRHHPFLISGSDVVLYWPIKDLHWSKKIGAGRTGRVDMKGTFWISFVLYPLTPLIFRLCLIHFLFLWIIFISKKFDWHIELEQLLETVVIEV